MFLSCGRCGRSNHLQILTECGPSCNIISIPCHSIYLTFAETVKLIHSRIRTFRRSQSAALSMSYLQKKKKKKRRGTSGPIGQVQQGLTSVTMSIQFLHKKTKKNSFASEMHIGIRQDQSGHRVRYLFARIGNYRLFHCHILPHRLLPRPLSYHSHVTCTLGR